jgi:formate dehydrogenase major subunit
MAAPVRLVSWLASWPVVRQLVGPDHLGLDDAVQSPRSRDAVGRVATADDVVPSICPYCAVGCAQRVFVEQGRITQIEGDPDSPISRGRLCPKGAATRQLVAHERRELRVKYRRPFGSEWESLSLDDAMHMIADRVIETRRNHGWEDTDEQGRPLRRSMSIAHLGGATLDNEENYLIKKLFTALGAIQIENQARI